MHRFFIPKEWIKQNKVSLQGEPAHQISHVLRLQPRDSVAVLDNSGWEYVVEIEKLNRELVQGSVVKKDFCPNEPAVKITLYQALLKIDKFEFVLQKGVEIGVSAFVPFLSERCVMRKPAESKIERWKKIIQESAEQSGRALLPVLHPVVSFEEACRQASTPAILLWEEEKQQGLSQFLKSASFRKAQAIALFVGPEGGFPISEVKYAQAHGITPASLGNRVLRAETASLAAISAILYEKGELG